MPNVELLQQTMQYIKDHPEEHDQEIFANLCGTAACFGGRAALLSGWTVAQIFDAPMWIAGARLVGITDGDAEVLFHCDNTIPMLELMVKDLINGDDLRRCQYYADQVADDEAQRKT